ncbi:MAG: SLC13/DASS family transporter, partial [Bacteroidales bacterium]|nr:SLC13/DASS family transporter [Bacteroidales bacterium]
TVIPFVLIVAYGASANYITPVGYLTNIMVYSTGSYKFNDFLKVGLPLWFLHLIISVSIIFLIYIH